MSRAQSSLQRGLIMSVSSISFWQQDQNYWNKAAQSSQQQQLSSTVINNLFGASTTLSAGLASIANQTALSRTNSQLTSAVQDALNSLNGGSSSTGSSTSSTSSSSSTGSSTSSSSSPTITTPASGTGTVPLSTSTSLFTLGILAKGTITVSDGTNTTTYQSTGKDTVGDLINAINKNAYGNAQATAYLNASGKLVITANNQTANIQIGGAYAANVGFGAGNNFFQPTTPTSASGGASSTSSGSSSSSSTSTSGSSSTTSSSSSSATSSTSAAKTSTTSTAAGLLNSAFQLQTGGTAEILLASNGLSGSLVNLIA
jgi:hypothetical protein